MKYLGITIGIITLVCLAMVSRSVFGLEKPQYTLISKKGSLEIRTYEPVVVATTPLRGKYKDSTRGGFRTIASYIFGGNEEEQKIAMTAPVLVENPEASEYAMAFVMPSKSVEQGLPTPSTNSLEIQSQDWGTVAVWSFGGWATEARLEKEWKKMQKALSNQNIQVERFDWIAQYNPPTMPPPFRHNEIWVKLQTDPVINNGT